MQTSNIPEELKIDGLWCNWQLTDKGKVPFNSLTGQHARSNDKSTFTSFKNAMDALGKYYNVDENGQVTGGLGLGIFEGFSAVDIDHCVDENGVISDMAQDIIDYCGSYTEFSPSGTGIRIIFKTNTNLDKKLYYINNTKIGLEIYLSDNTHKFVTITGDTLYSASINEIDISYILDKYMRRKAVTSNGVANQGEFDITKYKDNKLHELWNGTAPGSGANESELDLALCAKLAYYLNGDVYAIDDAFRSSPYYATKDNEHIKKWEVRDDYRRATIQKATEGVSDIGGALSNADKQKNYGLNDTGNAHLFINKYGSKIRYNIDNKQWMFWNNKFWQFDVFNHIKNLVEFTVEEMKHQARLTNDEEQRKAMIKNANRSLQRAGKEAMLKEAEHIKGVGVTNNDFDNDDFLFNTKSGVVDLRTGKMLEHDKDLMISNYTPYEISYKEPTKWLKFLDEIFESDEETIDYIHKAMGYSMTGSSREEVMFILLGDGNNGKSVLLEVFNEALGDYGATSNVDILIDNKYGSKENKGPIARLKGKRQVSVEEPELGDKLKESSIKTYTSGSGKIVARHLYANEFEFSPKMKFWMAANHKPTVRGTDFGIWRRLIIIKLNKIIEEKHIDKSLKNKLKQEMPEILGWMINGCLKWQKEGLKLPKKLEAEKHEYRSEMDVVQKWLDENCVLVPTARTLSSDLFDNFSEYVRANKEYQLTHTMFGRNMGKKFKKSVVYGKTKYIGVRIDNDGVLTEEEKKEV